MKSRLFLAAILALAFCAGSSPALAANHGEVNEFSWESAWGTIGFNGNPDTIIPTPRHFIKNSLRRSILGCDNPNGPTRPLSRVKTYGVDLKQNGTTQIIADYRSYFLGLNGGNQLPSCTVLFATPTSGHITIFQPLVPQQILTESPNGAPACPATPAANTTCRPDCAATVARCPQLFDHDYDIVWNSRVESWKVISENSFTAFANTLNPPIYEARNERPVFKIEPTDNLCGADEIAANDNKCVKYYQYIGNEFVDLYRYVPGAIGGQIDTRYTKTLFDESADRPGRGEDMSLEGDNSAHGIRLNKGKSFAIQIQGYDNDNDPDTVEQFTCYQATNTSQTSDYFVPTNSDAELASFINNPPDDINGGTCDLRFTDWTRTPGSCAGINVPCDSTVQVVARRDCQRSTTARAGCGECIDARIPGWDQGCVTTWTCRNSSNCSSGKGDHSSCFPGKTKIAMADGSEKEIEQLKAGDMVMGILKKDKPNFKHQPAKIKAVITTAEQKVIGLNDFQVTANHRIFLANGTDVAAGTVLVGDKILDMNNKPVVVEKITRFDKPTTVYNLDLEGADGFIAGGHAVLAEDVSAVKEPEHDKK